MYACVHMCASAVVSVTQLVVHLEELEFFWGGERQRRVAVHTSFSAKGVTVKVPRLCR